MKLNVKIGLKLVVLFLFAVVLLTCGCEARSPAAAGEENSDTSPESTSVVDKIASNLEAGNIAFNAPDNMMLAKPADIELLLSPKESIEKLAGND